MTRSLRPTRAGLALVLALVALGAVGCSSSSELRLDAEADATVKEALQADPSLKQFVDNSAGYVVFPSIGKGGFIVGGAHGDGVMFVNGRHDGYATLTQATIGAQIGGQTFKEMIFFKLPQDVEKFKKSEWALSANASAVAVTAGAGAGADYNEGVAVFVWGPAGLMLEASVGGQKFKYRERRDAGD